MNKEIYKVSDLTFNNMRVGKSRPRVFSAVNVNVLHSTGSDE